MRDCRTPLSLLTLNLWHDAPPVERVRVQRDLIENLSPDVIGFQEVLREGSTCQAESLLAGLGYQVAYGEVVPFWKRDGVLYGNAIASRLPILRTTNAALPRGASSERRSVVCTELAGATGRLFVACTHLHHREPEIRALQLRAGLRTFRDFCGESGGELRFFLGDLNSSPGMECTPLLSPDFRDAFEEAGSGDGLTWSRENPYAVVSQPPGVRIDYIWSARDADLEIKSCEVVGREPSAGVFASDHFGVFARYRL